MPIFSSTIENLTANTTSQPYYRFDGSNDEVAIGDSDHLSFGNGLRDSPFSIDVWINMEDATDFPIIHKGIYNSNAEWALKNIGDALYFALYDESVDNTYEQAATADITAYEGKWTHICATYDGRGGTSANAGITIYINGVSQSLTLTGNGTYVAMESLASGTRIGNYADSEYAKGSIGKLRIWNIVLSDTEVKEFYSGASVPWKYRGASNTSIVDADASTMDSGTHYWIGYPDYTMSNVSNQIRITDGGGGTMLGAYNYLNDTYDLNTDLTVGKKYNVRIDASYTGGNAPGMQINGAADGNQNVNLTTAMTTYNFFFIANTTASSFIRTYNMNNSQYVTIDNFEMFRAGLLAEYDGSGAASDKWFDKSGNDLHGGVSGATVENAPSGDDGLVYEEGTWTPVFGGTGGQSGQSYGIQVGTYKRIGSVVVASWYATLSDKGTITSTLFMSGFPYTSDSTSNVHAAAALARVENWTIDADHVLGLHMNGNSTSGTFTQYEGQGLSNSATVLSTAHVNDTTSLMGTMTYTI